MNENSVEGKPYINRESNSNDPTILLYSCQNINMKTLAFVTPPYIYHGCSTWKTFCEEKFTDKFFFLCANLKNCGRRKVRKHKENNGTDRYVTFDI